MLVRRSKTSGLYRVVWHQVKWHEDVNDIILLHVVIITSVSDALTVYDVNVLSPRLTVIYVTVGIDSQYWQKAHLHIVVLSISHHLAMFQQSNADDIIFSSLLSASLPCLILVTNVNNWEFVTGIFENIMARNETFNFDLSVQLDKKLD